MTGIPRKFAPFCPVRSTAWELCPFCSGLLLEPAAVWRVRLGSSTETPIEAAEDSEPLPVTNSEGNVSEQTRKRPAADPQVAPSRPPRGLRKFHARVHSNPATSLAWKIVITTVGSVVLLAGVIMFVTPGPALVLIPLGLAILATEWAWADRWLQKAKHHARRAKAKSDAMDPRVRRRRLMLSAIAFMVVVAAVTGYVVTYGWPSIAVDGWDWAQNLAGWLPELPGPTAESLDDDG